MPERPTRDDVRAAIAAVMAAARLYVDPAVDDVATDGAVAAVMPFIDQSYEAGMVDLTEHLRQELAKVRALRDQAEQTWHRAIVPFSNYSTAEGDAARARYESAKANYEGFLDAFHHAQNFSVGNAEKSTGVAWPGATPHVEGEK